MTFPAETVPDRSIMLPHHLTWGGLVALLTCWIVWDNYRHTEPVIAASGVTLALFAFLFVWPAYPVMGSSLSLAGLTVAMFGLLRPSLWWTQYPALPHLVALLAVLVALDDAVSHAFGVPTPVDWLWHVAVLPVMV